MSRWKLKRTKQCKNCPWRKDADLSKIKGYDIDQHHELKSTISPQGMDSICTRKAMACHESKEDNPEYCIGWLMQQVSFKGNNFGLRLHLRSCENANELETFGDQYDTLEGTFRGK